MAISEDKKRLIRQRIAQGRPLAEIAEEAVVSRDTVKRIKKAMPDEVYKAAEDSGDGAIKLTNVLTRMEKKYTEKLKAAVELYEDEEEGWCYHLDKADYRLRTSGCWWVAIVYPESAPEGWWEKLKAQGFELARSPLHDKDKWDHDSPEMVDAETGEIIAKGARYKAGDRKKAHWHVIIKSDKRMSFQEANRIIQGITHGPLIQKCRSLKNAYEYFLHINHPNKYQGYDKDEIVTANNFHLEPNKYEAGVMQCEIINTIHDNGMTEVWQLTEHYRDQPEYIAIIAAKPGIFTSLLHSLWNRQNPEGKVKRVKIVEDGNGIM